MGEESEAADDSGTTEEWYRLVKGSGDGKDDGEGAGDGSLDEGEEGSFEPIEEGWYQEDGDWVWKNSEGTRAFSQADLEDLAGGTGFEHDRGRPGGRQGYSSTGVKRLSAGSFGRAIGKPAQRR